MKVLFNPKLAKIEEKLLLKVFIIDYFWWEWEFCLEEFSQENGQFTVHWAGTNLWSFMRFSPKQCFVIIIIKKCHIITLCTWFLADVQTKYALKFFKKG